MENTILLIAEAITGKNKIIKPKPNSVFEYIDLIQGDNDKVQELSRTIGEKLGNEVELIKNKLLPFMKEAQKVIDDKVANYARDTESSKYKIVEFDMPVIISNLKEAGIMPANPGEPNRLQEESLNIPPVSKLDLSKYLELSNAVITSSLHVEIGRLSDDDILQLWEDYLGNISSGNTKLSLLLSDPVSNIRTIVILYAIVVNLLDNKPSDVDASDDKYYGILKQFRDELMNYMALADRTFNRGREKDRLVVGYSADGYTIKVDEKLYQKFIDEKYTPEVLLGLLVSNSRNDVDYMFYDKIIANADILTEEWKKKIKIEHYSETIKTISMYKAVYTIALPEIIELLPSDLREIFDFSPAEAALRLEEKLNNEKDSEIVDSTYMAREIVGYVLFPQTSFHKFTGYMIEIEKLNPEFEPKEIANFATVELLLNYLTDQLVIESI